MTTSNEERQESAEGTSQGEGPARNEVSRGRARRGQSRPELTPAEKAAKYQAWLNELPKLGPVSRLLATAVFFVLHWLPRLFMGLLFGPSRIAVQKKWSLVAQIVLLILPGLLFLILGVFFVPRLGQSFRAITARVIGAELVGSSGERTLLRNGQEQCFLPTGLSIEKPIVLQEQGAPAQLVQVTGMDCMQYSVAAWKSDAGFVEVEVNGGQRQHLTTGDAVKNGPVTIGSIWFNVDGMPEGPYNAGVAVFQVDTRQDLTVPAP